MLKVFKFKNMIIPAFFVLFTICLVLFSSSNLSAARNGLELWANSVIPSLFPFFVATELISYTPFINIVGKYVNKFMKPLFNVRGEGSFAFLMGILSGYPVGAKIVSNFTENGIVTKEEAERMLAFTNNSGPLFIIGTVGITLFGSAEIGFLLFITHVLSCITVGIVLRFFSKNYKNEKKSNIHNSVENKNVSLSSLGEILGKSITNSISTILLIGGFVVIFSVVISILNESGLLESISKFLSPILGLVNFPSEFIKPVLSGIVELTNGVSLVANVSFKAISTNIILCAFLLGFGGFSVLLQVFSIISKSGLSIKTYLYGKLLQGVFASIYTFLALQFLPFFQFNL